MITEPKDLYLRIPPELYESIRISSYETDMTMRALILRALEKVFSNENEEGAKEIWGF